MSEHEVHRRGMALAAASGHDCISASVLSQHSLVVGRHRHPTTCYDGSTACGGSGQCQELEEARHRNRDCHGGLRAALLCQLAVAQESLPHRDAVELAIANWSSPGGRIRPGTPARMWLVPLQWWQPELRAWKGRFRLETAWAGCGERARSP